MADEKMIRAARIRLCPAVRPIMVATSGLSERPESRESARRSLAANRSGRARPDQKHFQAKWVPVRVKKMRQDRNKAFSSEVGAGSRQENASR
jgi:hypothetical protein